MLELQTCRYFSGLRSSDARPSLVVITNLWGLGAPWLLHGVCDCNGTTAWPKLRPIWSIAQRPSQQAATRRAQHRQGSGADPMASCQLLEKKNHWVRIRGKEQLASWSGHFLLLLSLICLYGIKPHICSIWIVTWKKKNVSWMFLLGFSPDLKEKIKMKDKHYDWWWKLFKGAESSRRS